MWPDREERRDVECVSYLFYVTYSVCDEESLATIRLDYLKLKCCIIQTTYRSLYEDRVVPPGITFCGATKGLAAPAFMKGHNLKG